MHLNDWEEKEPELVAKIRKKTVRRRPHLGIKYSAQDSGTERKDHSNLPRRSFQPS